MDSRSRLYVFLALAIFLAPVLLLGTASASPAEWESFRSKSGTVSLSGRVVSHGAPVANAIVTERSTGQTVRTDSRGRFMISELPSGPTTLSVVTGSGTYVTRFQNSQGGRSRGIISIGGGALPGGSAAVFLPISGRGHEGEEIEGVITANDGTSILTVLDQRLGSVTVTTDANTTILHGNTVLTLADITVGMTVHAKAALQGDGTYLASVIEVQDENTNSSSDTQTDLSGTIKSITAPDFVLTTDSGDVTIHTDSSTVFMEKGQIKTFADLAVGDDAEADGILQGDGSLNASKVTFEPPETEEVEVQGTVKSVNAPSFVVTTESGDVTVTTDGSTQFFKDGHDPATFSDVVVGAQVEADGTLQSDGSVLASKVKIEGGGNGGND
jgi:Domain of unknown function (DUF5666)